MLRLPPALSLRTINFTRLRKRPVNWVRWLKPVILTCVALLRPTTLLRLTCPALVASRVVCRKSRVLLAAASTQNSLRKQTCNGGLMLSLYATVISQLTCMIWSLVTAKQRILWLSLAANKKTCASATRHCPLRMKTTANRLRPFVTTAAYSTDKTVT